MRILYLFLLLSLFMPGGMTAEACTAAVISGKATPDGRPMIWKHRNSDHPQNAIRYLNLK